VQEQIGRASVEPLDAARVSSWLGGTGDLCAYQSKIYAEWLEVDGFLTGLRAMGDKALRETYMQFADIQKEAENIGATEAATDDVSDNAADAEAKENAAAEAETDKRRLSKQGLAKMFEAKNTKLSKGKLEELMSRIDTNGNGEIDWLEFRALARSNSDLEMFFKGLPLERVLASCFARGAADDSLEVFFRQKHSDVVAGVLKAGHIIEAIIAGHIKKQNEARASQEQAAGGAKYGAELKGGTVEKFFEGVTGICGEPHPGVCAVCVCVSLSLSLSLFSLSLSLSLSFSLPYTLYCSLSLTYSLSLCLSLSLSLFLSRSFSRSFSPALFSLAVCSVSLSLYFFLSLSFSLYLCTYTCEYTCRFGAWYRGGTSPASRLEKGLQHKQLWGTLHTIHSSL
jgi:hypothetical protein